MRHMHIKIWPETVSYLPAFIPFEKIDYTKSNPINIDFSNTVAVTSSGLTLVLLEILKVISKSNTKKWLYEEPIANDIALLINEIGLPSLLQKKLKFQTLFSLEWNKNPKEINLIQDDRSVIHFPIYEFDYSNKSIEEKREAVNDFREYLFEKLKFLFDDYKFKINKLIQIFTEMAKNSADHSENNAYFGLDIFIHKSFFSIQFAFADMGIGINKNVRSYFLENPELQKAQRAKHLGLVETYHFALSPGKSTKPNSKINRGIGMTIILDVSKDLNINLSVFDAASRGILSKIEKVSHDDLRKIFYAMNKEVGFYYYGELKKVFE
ncbi:MAG: hypothetical protein ABIU77_18050 [Ferruginibacter sp.]